MFLHDLRASLSSLRRRPFHALVSVGVLALGLTTTTAVVTCVGGLQQTIPGIADPGALVQILSVDEDFVSFPDYQDYAAEGGPFASLVAAQHAFPGSMRLGDTTFHIVGQKVTGDYFSVLGARMAAGRGLSVEDDRPGAPPVVVLSHRTWRQHFGGGATYRGRSTTWRR